MKKAYMTNDWLERRVQISSQSLMYIVITTKDEKVKEMAQDLLNYRMSLLKTKIQGVSK